MSDFVTVFEIARGSNGVFTGEVFRLLIGVAALIGGVAALVFKRRNNGAKSWFGSVFVIAAERNFVFGLNVVGLRRAGFSAKDREEIKAAFKLVYQSGLNIGQALEKAATMKFGAPAREFLDFVANAKKRSICPVKRGKGNDLSI